MQYKDDIQTAGPMMEIDESARKIQHNTVNIRVCGLS